MREAGIPRINDRLGRITVVTRVLAFRADEGSAMGGYLL
jgi:hypothetical protein